MAIQDSFKSLFTIVTTNRVPLLVHTVHLLIEECHLDCVMPCHISMMRDGYFFDFIEDITEVLMDDFSVYDTNFDHCLNNLSKVL